MAKCIIKAFGVAEPPQPSPLGIKKSIMLEIPFNLQFMSITNEADPAADNSLYSKY